MRKLIPIFLLAVVLFVSCEEKENVKETLRLMQSHPVCLPLDEMQCCFRGNDTVMLDSIKNDFRLVVYVDSTECSPCLLDKMFIWNDRLEDAKKTPSQLKHIFIFAPKPEQLEDAYLSLQYCGLESPVYIDTAFAFRKKNPYFPENRIYHTFLLNRNDSILLVGNPMENPKIDEMLKHVLTNNKQKKL